jgi:hypothetical protein
VYPPVEFVVVSRVIEVCSDITVTVALEMTLPEGSETSPVMPPSVCCEYNEPQHSATVAAMASNREDAEGKTRLAFFIWLTSKWAFQ